MAKRASQYIMLNYVERYLYIQLSLYKVSKDYNPRFIFQRMMKAANGYSTIDAAIHANRMPKSSPIRECVPKRIVRRASTTTVHKLDYRKQFE